MAISSLKAGTTYAIHLECPSSSGGKEWVGSVTSSGEIHVFWGKKGAINQHSAKHGDKSKLQVIIDEKRSKGYSVVDEYHVVRGWDSQQRQSAPSSQQTTQAPALPKGPPVNLLKIPDEIPLGIDVPATVAGTLSWDF